MNNLEKQTILEERCALLIEDDIFCQKVQSHCLMDLGYTVEVASNAETAIDRIEHYVYHLIVLDLGLPDQSGELVIRSVRDSTMNQQTPLVVATAHADASMQQKCLYLGADVVFIKPFNKQSLDRAINFCHSRIEELSRFN